MVRAARSRSGGSGEGRSGSAGEHGGGRGGLGDGSGNGGGCGGGGSGEGTQVKAASTSLRGEEGRRCEQPSKGARAEAPRMGWQGGVASRSREISMPAPVVGVPRSSGYLRGAGATPMRSGGREQNSRPRRMSHDTIQKSIEIPIAVKLGLAVRSGKMSGTVLGSSG